VSFRPTKVSPEELQALCLEARQRFFGWGSILERLADRRANAQSPIMLGLYLGLNISAHYDIELRQGLRLGAGLGSWEERHDPVSA
jgi:hypothetical protein